MKVMMMALLSLASAIEFSAGQKRWMGSDNGGWENDSNWAPFGIPASTDDVLLDNNYQAGTYTVTLPATQVTIHSLAISPSTGKSISVVVPAGNISSPALSLNSMGEALVINNGGVFLNSSGLNSGQSLNIAGTIRINNGGRYVHNSRSTHANDIVAKLSTADGTESGIFEFSIPSASSTISLSNRNFGTLRLSSANGGNVVYSGSGTNPLIIRSDLEILPGVSFSISFSNAVKIKNQLLMKGGNFNIANAAAATALEIGGNLTQQSGTITKTGVAIPSVIFNGSSKQQLSLNSGIHGDIMVRFDNPSGFDLNTPLTLSYRCELLKGRISSSKNNLFSLDSFCTLKSDSVSGGFVEGPMKKAGLKSQSFLFPIGKGQTQRWLKLENANGDFTVSYENTNPNQLCFNIGAGIDHISDLEGWKVEAARPADASGNVVLSFDNVNSGGVTDLATLRVAHLLEGCTWKNEGNLSTTGSAGSAGSVLSEKISNLEPGENWFTLASSVSNHNTLPSTDIDFAVRKSGPGMQFTWQVFSGNDIRYFIVQGSTTFNSFENIEMVPYIPGQNSYQYYYYPGFSAAPYKTFRLQLVLNNGYTVFSKTIAINKTGDDPLIIFPDFNNEDLNVETFALTGEQVNVTITDMEGRIVQRAAVQLTKGKNKLKFDISRLAKQAYVITLASKTRTTAKMFFRK